MTLTQRETLSCVVFSSKDKDAYDQAEVFAQTRLDLEIIALKESEYYENFPLFMPPSVGWHGSQLSSYQWVLSYGRSEYLCQLLLRYEREIWNSLYILKAIFLSIVEEAMSTGALAAIALMIGLIFIRAYLFLLRLEYSLLTSTTP